MYHVNYSDVWESGPLGLCSSPRSQWAPVWVYYLVLELVSAPCEGICYRRSAGDMGRGSWKHRWMQGQISVVKGKVETIDVKAWRLILYLLQESVSPKKAAPMVLQLGCPENLLSWMQLWVGVRVQ